MFLLRLAVKNVLRKSWRSLITATPVLVGVMMTILGWGFIDGIDSAVIFGQIKSDSGHFRVMAEGYLENEEQAELDELIDDSEAVVELLRDAGEARLHPRLTFTAEISDGRNGLMARGVGIEPETYFEDFVLPIESAFTGDAGGLQPMWLGAGLAGDFDVAPGDTLTVLARTRYGSYNANEYLVRGLIRSQNPAIDSVVFFIPLADARELLDADGAASEVVGVMPRRASAVDLPARLAPRLAGAGLEIQTWRQRAEPILRVNRIRRKILGIIAGIIILVAATGIMNTVVMAAFERIREIGALRALGLQTEGVVVLFVAEALIIGLVGAAAGCGLGAALVHWFSGGLDFSAMSDAGGLAMSTSMVLYMELDAAQIATAFLIGVGMALIAALYPAIKFSRLPPVEAMRR
ncbi:MAG: ABC transporter permease [bacterium]|nr:ABC transporter permease [bacterium]